MKALIALSLMISAPALAKDMQCDVEANSKIYTAYGSGYSGDQSNACIAAIKLCTEAGHQKEDCKITHEGDVRPTGGGSAGGTGGLLN